MPEFVLNLESKQQSKRPKIVVIDEHRKAETKRKLFLIKRKNVEESSEMKKAVRVIRKVCLAKK